MGVTLPSPVLGLGRLRPLPRTLLGHNRYAEIMQINPSHFNQMAGPLVPVGGGCDSVWDHNARYALEMTISRAEKLIAEQLQFWPAPKYITNEQVQFGHIHNLRFDWWYAPRQTRWGYVEAFGTERYDVIERGVPVSYFDLDSDPHGRKETAIIGGPGLYSSLQACGNSCQVAVFVRPSDGATDEADPRWEIRPLIIDRDDPDMTIRGEAAYFIKPTLWRLTEKDCALSDGPKDWIYDFDEANLLTEVDVFCRVTNPETPVCLKWDNICGCVNTAECTHSTQKACALIDDNIDGHFQVRPATWNGSSNQQTSPLFSKAPGMMTINYLAGYPLDDDCRINYALETAIVKLTNVLLPTPPCEFCDAARVRWVEDRANIDPLTPEAAGMPWAIYQRGALEAWRVIKMLALEQGGKL